MSNCSQYHMHACVCVNEYTHACIPHIDKTRQKKRARYDFKVKECKKIFGENETRKQADIANV